MSTSNSTVVSTENVAAPVEAEVAPDELSAESLIEEVSIDGMCGVY